MSSEDIEILSTYMDGELSSVDAEIVEQRLKHDANFRKLLQMLRKQDLYLRASINSIDKVPLKPELERLLGSSNFGSSDKVVSMFKYRLKRLSALGISISAAALLLVAAYVGFNNYPAQSPENIVQTPIQLDSALSILVSGRSISVNGETYSENLAFERQDGVLCKHYTRTQGETVNEGVACFEGKVWLNPIAELSLPAKPAKEMYTPAGNTESSISQYIENQIQGTALSAEEENAKMRALHLH